MCRWRRRKRLGRFPNEWPTVSRDEYHGVLSTKTALTFHKGCLKDDTFAFLKKGIICRVEAFLHRPKWPVSPPSKLLDGAVTAMRLWRTTILLGP